MYYQQFDRSVGLWIINEFLKVMPQDNMHEVLLSDSSMSLHLQSDLTQFIRLNALSTQEVD